MQIASLVWLDFLNISSFFISTWDINKILPNLCQGFFLGNKQFYESNVCYVCIPTYTQIWSLCSIILIQNLSFKFNFLKCPLFYDLHCISIFSAFKLPFNFFSFTFSSFCPLSSYSNSFCLCNLRVIQAFICFSRSPKQMLFFALPSKKIPEMGWCMTPGCKAELFHVPLKAVL